MRYTLLVFSVLLIFSGCGDNFELNDNVTGKHLELVDQDSSQVQYPDVIKNKIAVIGFIYTHCPDICPMTAHNMMLAQEHLSKSELLNVKFLLVSFDPERDTPSVLSQYAYVRGIDMNYWDLLTGSRNNIEPLLKEFNVKAFPDDTTYNSQGKPEYFMIHTDRISLVDEHGNLRKNYKGSTVKPEEIVDDIKKLL